jgi:hypothetical protein
MNFGILIPGGYGKSQCFFRQPNAQSKEQYKDWFFNEKARWGKSQSKLINRWKKDNGSLVKKFILDFNKAHEFIVKKYNLF